MQQISVVTLNGLLGENKVEHLIDVRSPEEFADLRHDTAVIRNVPLDQIAAIGLPKDATIYVTCLSGARSAAAQQKLASLGYRNVINVMGGVMAWKQAGYATTRGKGYK